MKIKHAILYMYTDSSHPFKTMLALTQSIFRDTADTKIETIPTYSIAKLLYMIHKFSGKPTAEQFSAFQKSPYRVDSFVMTQSNTAEFPLGLVRSDMDSYLDWDEFVCSYTDGNHIRLRLDTVFSSEWATPFPTVTRAPFTNMDGSVCDTEVMCFTEEDIKAIDDANAAYGESDDETFLCRKYKSCTVLTLPFQNRVEVQFILPDVGKSIVDDYTTFLTDMNTYVDVCNVKATRVVIPKLEHTTHFSMADFLKRTGQFDTVWNKDGHSAFFSSLLTDPKNHVKLVSFDYKAKLVMDENGSTFETCLDMDCYVSRGGGPTIDAYAPFEVNRPYLIRFLYQGSELLLTAVKSM